ncbi:MAG: hypothetical protein ND866_22905 [Pyrinomonadaceae bacterium]|nr:hypothetical protein [Pyrinomonadaceae bacterium]
MPEKTKEIIKAAKRSDIAKVKELLKELLAVDPGLVQRILLHTNLGGDVSRRATFVKEEAADQVEERRGATKDGEARRGGPRHRGRRKSHSWAVSEESRPTSRSD